MKGHGLISAAFVLVAVAAAQTLLGAAAAAKPGTVITYPTPSIYGVSATYALKANGKAVPVVEFAPQYDYAVFALDGGPCTLEVTRLDGTPVKKHEISPQKLSLAGSASGATLSFTTHRLWFHQGALFASTSAPASTTSSGPYFTSM